MISRSTNEFVQALSAFQDLTQKTQTTNGVGTVSRGTSKGKPTVSDTFRYGYFKVLLCLINYIFSCLGISFKPW